MPRGHLDSFMRSLRRWAGGGCALRRTDRQLLERYVREREEAAFAALVRSHAPMILGICYRLLHNTHDAEDAVQAAFLVLARKAGSISKGESVGSWLYGVAYRIAARERSNQALRVEREKEICRIRAKQATDQDLNSSGDRAEQWSILSEEMNRLPEKYRAPLVLHYLEGKTKDETALQLGWPEGTVSGRLARGREILRTRLVKRGVEASSSAFIVGLAIKETVGFVPQPLMTAILENAKLSMAGKTVAVSSKVLALAEGVQRAMFISKLKMAAAIVLAIGVVASGTAWTVASLPAGKADEKPSAETKPEPKKAQKPPKTDLERMQGDWKVTFRKDGGREAPKEYIEDWEYLFLIHGDSLIIRDKSKIVQGTVKLDSAATPKTIDMTIGNGAEKREGIYTFEGDKLKVCWAGWHRQRPNKFSAEKEDKGDGIMILERDSYARKDLEDEARKNKEKEARLRMAGSLYELGLAMHRYHDELGHFPHAAIKNKEGKAVLSWRVALLPSLGFKDLYEEFKLNESWDSPHNKPLLANMPKVFAAPEGGKEEKQGTYYQVFVGQDTVFEEGKDIPYQDITDGTVSTILIIEGGKPVPWTKPEDLPFSPDKPLAELGGAIGDGLISLITADGSPHRLRKGVDEEFTDMLRAYIKRNSGRIKNDWKDLDPKDLDH